MGELRDRIDEIGRDATQAMDAATDENDREVVCNSGNDCASKEEGQTKIDKRLASEDVRERSKHRLENGRLLVHFERRTR